jgi:hypothetical protein
MTIDEKSYLDGAKPQKNVVVSTDVEYGLHSLSSRTARDAPVELQYICNYLPWMTTQHAPSRTTSAHASEPNGGPTAEPSFESTESSAVLNKSSLTQSESGQGDTKPPPMVPAASTSDTEGDEDSSDRQSMPDESSSDTDPFAPRLGKTLCWRNINMTLVSPKRT